MIMTRVSLDPGRPPTSGRLAELLGRPTRLTGPAPGLLTAHFQEAEDGRSTGAFHHWRTREQAERYYGDAWYEAVEVEAGCRPVVGWFDVALIVDNRHGEILTASECPSALDDPSPVALASSLPSPAPFALTCVEYLLPDPVTVGEWEAKLVDRPRLAADIPGLIRSQFVVAAGGRWVGGLHLWTTRTEAHAHFDDRWWATSVDLVGVEPHLDWYTCPLVVDHRHQEILTGPTEQAAR